MATESDLGPVGLSLDPEHVPKMPSRSGDTKMRDRSSTGCATPITFHPEVSSTVMGPTVINRSTDSIFTTPKSEDNDPFGFIPKRDSHGKSISDSTSILPTVTLASDTKTKQKMNEVLLMNTDDDVFEQGHHIDEVASQETDSDVSLYMEDEESDYSPGSESGDDDNDSNKTTPGIEQVQHGTDMQKLRDMVARRNQLQSQGNGSYFNAAQEMQLQFMDDSIQKERKRLHIPKDANITTFPAPFGAGTLQRDEREAKAKKHRSFPQGKRATNAKEWFLKHGTDPDVLEGSRKRKQSRSEKSVASASKRQKNSSSRPLKLEHTQIKGSEKLFGSLLHNNPIEAHQKWGDVPETEVKATNKRDQLQQLTDGAATGYTNKASDKRKLEIASRAFGFGKCVAEDGKWKLEGMKSRLLNHQVTGVAWMLQREFSPEEPRGGILADEMGMGKTVSMLSCIVSNQPTSEDLQRHRKTTLIIMPATVIKQWQKEIERHMQNGEDKIILHFKTSMKLSKAVIKTADIIIASYHEIASQYPTEKFQDTLHEKLEAEQLDAKTLEEQYQAKFEEALGPLFKIPFWRVVLDEAHAIKNKSSQTSIACRALKGHHRWAMTATPLQNSVDELFPYMNFIREPKADSFKEFKKSFGTIEHDDALPTLNEKLLKLMLRRTSSDKFMGKPHFALPKPYDDVEYINLTREEMFIYKEIEKCFREAINDVIKNNDTESKEKNMLALITYLRMATTHPFLLEGVLSRFLTKESIDSIKEQLSEIGGRQSVYEQIGIQIAYLTGNSTRAGLFGKNKFESHFDMNKQLDIALAVQQEGVCRICLDVPTLPKRAECNHIFCTKCINGYIRTAKKDSKARTKCPECNRLITGLTRVDDELHDVDDGDNESATSSRTHSQQNQTKSYQDAMNAAHAPLSSIMKHEDGGLLGHDALEYHPKLKKSEMRFFDENDRKIPREPITPSAKTTAIKATILQWLHEAPDDKILIFSQFNKMSVIIGRMLQDEKIPFLYFDGGLVSTRKQIVVNHFHESPIKVMIVSLKCGGVALNLTCANRVILADLWWNTSIEQQAFGRVFRYGQEKETHFKRIVAKDTIDQRIIDLQSKKCNEITQAMANGKSLGNSISFEDGVSLFGRVVKDKEGKIQKVIAHDDY